MKLTDKNKFTEASKWPKPYRWMIEDLEMAQKAEANYLVALGLFCYTEIVGRYVLKFRNPKQSYFKNKECFNVFFKEYMGYGELIKQSGDKIYNWFRHGLCHRYPIKGLKTGVYIRYDLNSIQEFTKSGIDTTKGIISHNDNKARYLVIEPYLKDFREGIKKFLQEKEKESNVSCFPGEVIGSSEFFS